MPIKVRCKECSTVLTVSDKAAGKAVKCKSCGARVAVRVRPKDGSQPAKKKRKKKRPPADNPFDTVGSPDDMLAGLDLGRAEDHDQKLCPNCAKAVDEEDIECPSCGVNIDTGALSVQQKKRRARKGPPPEEFYGAVWKNGWRFLMNHKGFAFKTGLLWGFSGTMVIIAAFVLSWYTRTRAVELVESASSDGVTITDSYVLIEPGEDTAEYDGVKYTPNSTRLDKDGRAILDPPHIAAMFSPPSFFWAFIFLVFTLAFGGWAWTLCDKIVELTLAKEKKIKRFQGDMFGNMTKGFTSIFWPVVLMYPVIWIPVAMYFGGVDQTACIITFVCLFLLPYFIFLPVAIIHMSQTYTYRAWLITWMTKDLFNTFVPSLFTSAIFIGTVLLIPLGIGIGVAAGFNQVAEFYTNRMEVPALGAMFGYTLEDADSSGSFAFYRLPFMFAVAFLGCTFLGTLLAFPAIFMMRVFGLFGLYFRPDMDLCVEQVPLSPAGFGPRFLAIQVDMVVATVMCVASLKGARMVYNLVRQLYDSETVGNIAMWASGGIAIAGALGFYFANWESGSGRATLGKWTFGMLVLQDDNSPMSFKLAMKRFVASLMSVFTLSGTFVMCAFHPEHRALHDKLTKTKVVWRGDENM